MTISPVNIVEIRDALANLDRIAQAHPELIDYSRSNWTVEDIMAMLQDKPIYDLEELADAFGVHPETLRRHVRQGKLKAVRLGKFYKVSKPDLEVYWRTMGGGRLFPEDTE